MTVSYFIWKRAIPDNFALAMDICRLRGGIPTCLKTIVYRSGYSKADCSKNSKH
jgi:hypothetical protein